MSTGKLTLTTFLTLDGVMQAPGGANEDQSGNFQHGGWLVPYVDDVMFRIVGQRFGNADAFVLGRKTYQIFAAYWPRITDPADPVASALNRLPKYVASKTLQKTEWHNSSLIRGDLAEQVAELKRRYPREIQIHGSGDLAQTLIARDLVDEYHLWLYPVILGTGKRLFASGTIPAALTLAETTTTSTGVVVSIYRRAGKPTYGSFELDQA
ncbi:MAG TPA: dihydrofolate reductase family protein [Gemmatimonadales bacterium]|nr:dihydrofolate reductase family protein [Gemmatimonadales bacterium]